MHSPIPLTRDVVLVGGGHTHALVLRRWGMKPLPGARLTVINPAPSAPYTGMLPGHVAGHYSRDELDIDLVRLCRFAGARLILGRAMALDPLARTVTVEGRGALEYDIASLDIGVSSEMPDLPGFPEHGIAAKPLDRFATAWADFLSAVRSGSRAEVAVLGGGVAGVELALAMNHALARIAPSGGRVVLVEKDRVLAGLPHASRAQLLHRLSQSGVELREGEEVAAVTAEGVTLSSGSIASRFTVSATGARPHGWLADTGLALSDGYVKVDETLRAVDLPSVYAVGDCAHLVHAPRPKAGVFAVREAPILYWNIRADLTGRQRRAYQPQHDFLKIISMGGKSAIATKWGVKVAGPPVWHWKDRIDRHFMDKFRSLPAMPAPRLPDEVAHGVRDALGPGPLCGGCGAKIGQAGLAKALALPTSERPDIELLSGDDAAALRFGDRVQVISTDHLRALTEDPWLMARIAAIHALGDIWAMGAQPQAALATVILPRLSPLLQDRWLSEIMISANSIFSEEGATIVGGHTSMGDTLTLGFTVTGTCDRPPVTLLGAQPGDLLILTKPIGSGTVMAAEMRGAARGADVAAALASMARPQGAVATHLAQARAMTDVTGFGLAGHLMNICVASRVAARVHLDSVPLLPGAAEISASGVRSTVFAANREVATRMRLTGDPREALLFDPQTSGGLLAALAPEDAKEAIAAIRGCGHEAHLIGEILDGAPAIEII